MSSAVDEVMMIMEDIFYMLWDAAGYGIDMCEMIIETAMEVVPPLLEVLGEAIEVGCENFCSLMLIVCS